MGWIWARPVWLLWLPPLVWSSNIVLSRAYSHAFPPIALTCSRWLVAFLVLLPLVWSRAIRQLPVLRAHWLLILLCGILGIAGYSILGYMAAATTTAANIAFINSTLPLMVPLMATVVSREPLSARTVFGAVISFAGVAWLVLRGDPRSAADLSFRGGDFQILAGVANYALYSVLIRRKPPELDLFVFLLATIAAGEIVLLPFWIHEALTDRTLPLDPLSIGIVIYLGLIICLLGGVVWNRCIVVLGATVTGASYHLLAVFTALLAAICLGERLEQYHVAGFALILTGVALATARRRHPRPDRAPGRNITPHNGAPQLRATAGE
ncbi:MAG: DMT family transporter [Azospirillaceae bacterium]|nr:DMT family transporter [Azospirillaceae bacterium]